MKKGTSSVSGEMDLVDDRAREVQDTYYRREREVMDEYRASQEPDTSLSQEQESILKSQTYLESARCKNGYVYGIGSASSLYYSKDSLSFGNRVREHTSSAKVLQLEGEVANNKTEIEVLKKLIQDMQLQMLGCRPSVFDGRADDRRDPPSPSAPLEQTMTF